MKKKVLKRQKDVRLSWLHKVFRGWGGAVSRKKAMDGRVLFLTLIRMRESEGPLRGEALFKDALLKCVKFYQHAFEYNQRTEKTILNSTGMKDKLGSCGTKSERPRQGTNRVDKEVGSDEREGKDEDEDKDKDKDKASHEYRKFKVRMR